MHKDTDVHFDIMGESCFCGYVRIWNSRRSCCVAKNSKKVMDILWKKKNCVSPRYVGWRFRNRREICVGTFACVLDKRMLGILVLKLRWSAYSHFSWAAVCCQVKDHFIRCSRSRLVKIAFMFWATLSWTSDSRNAAARVCFAPGSAY